MTPKELREQFHREISLFGLSDLEVERAYSEWLESLLSGSQKEVERERKAHLEWYREALSLRQDAYECSKILPNVAGTIPHRMEIWKREFEQTITRLRQENERLKQVDTSATFQNVDSLRSQLSEARQEVGQAYEKLADCSVWEHWDDELVTSYCAVCGGGRGKDNGNVIHKPYCIVLKAQGNPPKEGEGK